MLIQFRVKNFSSFKDEACISFLANAGKENENNYVTIGKNNILKCASIYGANASGKSNLLKAFTASIIYIRQSFNFNPNSEYNFIVPFAFSKETVGLPSEFEYIFICDDIKYVYGFSATKRKVYEEYLYAYYSAKPTEIFSRKNTNVFNFLYEDEKELKVYERLALDNKLFLSVLGNTKYEKTVSPFKWFNKLIDTYIGGVDNYMFDNDSTPLEQYDNDSNGELKEFSLKLLNAADILIDDYEIESKEMPLDPIFVSPLFQGKAPTKKSIKINMKHKIKDEDGESDYYLDLLNSESSGTRIIFMLAPILKNAFEKGKTLYIDEFENGLHPYLLDAIIDMFNSPEFNKANAQLIINTHNTNLLSLNKFRRDQIWFVEKDANTGNSTLYSLDDFSVRKEENIRNGYLNGRYGAVPYMSFGDDFYWKKTN